MMKKLTAYQASVVTVFIVLAVLSSTYAIAKCADNARIETPQGLPNYKTCTSQIQNGCEGWKPIGDTIDTKDLSLENGPGQLYQWEGASTVCFLFKRGNDINSLTGVHCYNTTNCDVCAYDGGGTLFEQLKEGLAVADNCTSCHVSGPILPGEKIWKMAHSYTKSINNLCVSKGGPRWVDAPSHWQKPDLSKRVPAPTSCSGCHEYFIPGGSFTEAALQGKNASMRKYFFDVSTQNGLKECSQFSIAMRIHLNCSQPN